MAWLTGRAGTGLAGTRVPVRVENRDGVVLATTVTEPDGAWAVWLDQTSGTVVVDEGRARRYELDVHAQPGDTITVTDVSPEADYPPGSPGDSPRARARRKASR